MMLPIQPLTFKPPKLRGLPRAQLDTAYEHHYGQVLQQHNALAEKIESDKSANRSTNLDEERAAKAVEASLFECYFQSLTDEETGAPSSALVSAINSSFGSVKDFESQMKSAAAGSDGGWLTWTKQNLGEAMGIAWTSASVGVPIGQQCLLAIPLQRDVREIEFADGIDAYVDAVLSNVSWHEINSRFAGESSGNASTEYTLCAPEALAQTLKSGSPVTVIDVRQPDDLGPDDVQVNGSHWCDPGKVADWANSVAGEKEVVVYCVYGGWVSQTAAVELKKQGVSAKVLAGGISSWRALGLATQELDENAASNT